MVGHLEGWSTGEGRGTWNGEGMGMGGALEREGQRERFLTPQ